MNTSLRSDRAILDSCERRAHVGGGYFNPVAMLEEHGRKICGSDVSEIGVVGEMHFESFLDDTFFVDQLMKALQERILHNEWLFGVYQKPRFKVGVMIPDCERLIEFEIQVAQMAMRRCGFYGVENDVATEGLQRDFEPK